MPEKPPKVDQELLLIKLVDKGRKRREKYERRAKKEARRKRLVETLEPQLTSAVRDLLNISISQRLAQGENDYIDRSGSFRYSFQLGPDEESYTAFIKATHSRYTSGADIDRVDTFTISPPGYEMGGYHLIKNYGPVVLEKKRALGKENKVKIPTPADVLAYIQLVNGLASGVRSGTVKVTR